MTYQDIDRVNSEISMLDLKGKNYAMVPERVTAFRKLYPEGFIKTDIIHLSDDGSVVMMKASAGYYREDGTEVVLGSGMAKEVQGKGMVNGTSHIENCETSAVGRALGMIGLGLNGGGICSAEELVNAITAQRQNEFPKTSPKDIKKDALVEVTTNKVPQYTEAQAFLSKAIKKMAVDIPEMSFPEMRKNLVADGLIDDVPSEKMSLDDATIMVDLMYQRWMRK